MILHSLSFYTVISLSVTIALIWYAVRTHAWRYYQTTVFLTTSKTFVILSLNCIALMGFWSFFLLRRVLFGSIRDHEWEGIAETMSFQLVQTLFSVSYFKLQISLETVVSFFWALCFTSLHLLAKARLDTLEQGDHEQSKKTHLTATLCVLVGIDAFIVRRYILSFLASGFDVSSVLLVEWSLNLLHACVLIGKIGLQALEKHKRVSSLAARHYLALFHNFFHCAIELVYFCFVFREFGLPVHFFREIYVALRGVVQSTSKALNYRKQCSIITSFADIPVEKGEEACVICMESLLEDGQQAAKTLPCGHMFHTSCLFRFIEKDSACPICRRNFLNTRSQVAEAAQRRYNPAEHKDTEPLDEEHFKPIKGDIQRSLRLIRARLSPSDLENIQLDSYLLTTREMEALHDRYMEMFAYVYAHEVESKNSLMSKVRSVVHGSRAAVQVLFCYISTALAVIFRYLLLRLEMLLLLIIRFFSSVGNVMNVVSTFIERVDREVFQD